MSKQRVSVKIFILGLLLVLILPMLLAACEPLTIITFDNQRDQVVRVFVAHVRDDGTIDELTDYGTIPANTVKKISITFLGDEWVNRIELVGPSGNVAFSHDYNRADLEKIDWKVAIPPQSH